jgi:hypothetical protein
MKTAAVNLTTDHPLESLDNNGQDSFSFETGIDEPLVKLNEAGESPAYGDYQEERTPEEQFQYATASRNEESKPLSLFERLIGRKSQPNRLQDPSRRPHFQTTPQPKIELDSEADNESIEIPAFLRRQINR